MRTLHVLALAAVLAPAFAQIQTPAQTPARTTPQAQPQPSQDLTQQRAAYQQVMKGYDAQIAKLRATALAALSAETAREKVPPCPNAVVDVAIDQCFAHENAITVRNYKTFAQAVRAMLALPSPHAPGLSTPVMGPSGPEATPATNTAAFDKAEAAWHTYAKAECDATDTYWRGGTIVNAMDGQCSLRLARARLHELDMVYNITHPM